MSRGMGLPPPGKVKRRKNAVKEYDILHCKVAGKCRIYGFPLWNIDGDPTLLNPTTRNAPVRRLCQLNLSNLFVPDSC